MLNSAEEVGNGESQQLPSLNMARKSTSEDRVCCTYRIYFRSTNKEEQTGLFCPLDEVPIRGSVCMDGQGPVSQEESLLRGGIELPLMMTVSNYKSPVTPLL